MLYVNWQYSVISQKGLEKMIKQLSKRIINK